MQSKRTAQKCDDIVRPLSKGKVVMYVYLITNKISGNVYIGITRASLNKRWKSHVRSAIVENAKSKLYDAMRSYGVENFSIAVLEEVDSEEEMLSKEKYYIAYYRNLHGSTYNILDGGKSYFPIVDKKDWKNKLKKARVGRKPALGMKHSSENRALFKKVSDEYWETQDTLMKKNEDITAIPFREATKLYGVSKTHYYRMKRELGLPNERNSYNPEEVLKHSKKDAMSLFGISARYYHYIRRKHTKQTGNNEPS